MVVIVHVQCSLDPTDIENRDQKSAETHTCLVNGPLSGTTRVSGYQKGKTNLDFTTARDSVAVAPAGPYASLHLAPAKNYNK